MTSSPTLRCRPASEPDLVAAAPLPEVVFRPPPAWKRGIDLVCASGLLVLLSPLLICLGLYIKFVSRGPILFSQKRIGAGMREFVIFKFRTMEADRETMTNRTETHGDYVAQLAKSDQPIKKPEYRSQLIRGGNFLRKLSLDELPQLINVLQGNMSLVGPRPDVLDLEHYENWQLRRFEVLPGISGLWQVSGKNSLTFSEMVRLDIRYIDNLSCWNDIKIMLKTLTIILSQNNE